MGGTKVLGGLVLPDGSVAHRVFRPTPAGADPGLHTTLAVAQALLEHANAHGLTVAGIGAGFPEYVRDGQLTSNEVLAWTVQPDRLLAALAPGTPVAVESDVRCGALAEAVLGLGAEHRSVVYVSWGTGLSSTLVLDGHCYAGRRGEAIAFGELGVQAEVDPTWTGNLERFASGRGIGERYSALTGHPAPGAREVSHRAVAGDPVAAKVLDDAGQAVGQALAWLVAVLDPDVIVLGGGLGTSGSIPVQAAVRRLATTIADRPDGPRLEFAKLGQDAGLIGAALVARGRTFSSPR